MISFKNGNNDPKIYSFDQYYRLLAEIKCFNALIEKKPFIDQSVENIYEGHEKPT